MYYLTIIIPAAVIPLMGTSTFLMDNVTSQRITLLSLFFIFELLYILFLDIKISNNGDYLVYLMLLYRNSFIQITFLIILSVISDEFYKHSIEEFPCNAPEWIKIILNFFLSQPKMIMLTNFNNKRSELLAERNIKLNISNSQRNENTLFWKTLSILLDYLAFIINLVLSLTNFVLLIL